MSSIWETPFIVVDVETTGSDAEKNRLTDIACVTALGGEIVSQFSSMVNPRQFIPAFIAQMTGISNEMAFQAPEAEEVLPSVAKVLSIPGAVFVAHNASFDWKFVEHSLLRASIEVPEIPKLDTLKLAKRLLPSNIKKNVGNLARFLNIPVRNRHRALGDASATAGILIELLELAEQDHGITEIDELLSFQSKPSKHFKSKKKISEELQAQLAALPEEPGVYYFRNKSKRILYVGKAKSLKDRVRSYFGEDSPTKKIADLVRRIDSIKYELTGTELAALLLESKEIKRLKPPYNSADKRYRSFPFIKIRNTEFPKIEICFDIEADGAEYFGPFRSQYLVQDIIKTIDIKFRLRHCDKKITPNADNKPCFYFQINKCASPCSGIYTKEDYNAELDKVRNFLRCYTDGIMNLMEAKMTEYSDAMRFEEAGFLKNRIIELKRVLDRKQNVPTSVNENNLILIIPASSREKTVEIFFIKYGKLVLQRTIGRKASLSDFFYSIHDIYFNGYSKNVWYTIEDIDELKIISSWLYRQQQTGCYIYLDGKAEDEICIEFESSVRNIIYEEDIK